MMTSSPPNDLNCSFEFAHADGKPRMITFEVRYWITNHEAEVGTPTLGTHDETRSQAGSKLG